jgi:hypothetical protein
LVVIRSDPGVRFSRHRLFLRPKRFDVGAQAAFVAECFTPRLRYSGASIGFRLPRWRTCVVDCDGLLAATGSGC